MMQSRKQEKLDPCHSSSSGSFPPQTASSIANDFSPTPSIHSVSLHSYMYQRGSSKSSMPKTATRLLSLSMVLVAPPNLVFPIQTRVLDLVTTAQIQTPNILATPNESSNSAPSFWAWPLSLAVKRERFQQWADRANCPNSLIG